MPIGPTSSIAQTLNSNVDLQGLLQVLLVEMRTQNPLKPVEHKDLIGQIAQFTSLDLTQQLNQNTLQLLSLQALSQSVQLVQKTVSAQLDDGTMINGKVTAVTLTPEGAPRLTITTATGVFTDIGISAIRTILP